MREEQRPIVLPIHDCDGTSPTQHQRLFGWDVCYDKCRCRLLQQTSIVVFQHDGFFQLIVFDVVASIHSTTQGSSKTVISGEINACLGGIGNVSYEFAVVVDIVVGGVGLSGRCRHCGV